jgi:RyR domain
MNTLTARFTDEEIAELCHENIRVLQRLHRDPSPSTTWFSESEDIRQSAIAGVRAARAGATSRELHASWVQYKMADGWRYGPDKDPVHKTHPCIRSYDELPDYQKEKDELFLLIVAWAASKTGKIR